MGIFNPRPQMRKRERRVIEARLARHAELMREHESAGMSREDASRQAMRDLLAEENGYPKLPRSMLIFD